MERLSYFKKKILKRSGVDEITGKRGLIAGSGRLAARD
jgi:hypothetical protein